MKIVKIILIVLCILIIAFMIFVYWLPSYIMTGKRQTLDEAFKWQSDHYDTSFYENLKKEDYIVKGFEDYDLHVQYLKNPNPTNKYIIISHGYTDNRIGTLKYVQIYLGLNYNCIIYDLRGHGLNDSTYTTYGIKEAKDLICLINDTKERYGDIKTLGIHGESLGAATSLTSLKYNPGIDFVVADCGFSDIENVLKGAYKKVGVPEFLVDVSSFTAKIRYGYALKEMRPIDSLNENEIPILFIHGQDDDFILPKNSIDMANKTKGYKEIHIIPNAGHAASVIVDPVNYKKYVNDFLNHLFNN